MAFCGKCGAQLHEAATFCANCGASTGTSAQAAAAPALTHTATASGGPGPRGFWGSFFDLSFTNFVTMKVVKVLFVLAIIGAVLGTIFIMVSASELRGLPVPTALIVILAPIIGLLYLLIARVYMEIITVTFRMVEYLRELVEQGRGRG